MEDYGDDPFESISDEDFFEGTKKSFGISRQEFFSQNNDKFREIAGTESPLNENNNFRARKRVGSPHPSNLSGSSGGRYRVLPHIPQPERAR